MDIQKELGQFHLKPMTEIEMDLEELVFMIPKSKLLKFIEKVCREQREADLSEIEDEAGTEYEDVIRAIKSNINHTPLITDRQ